MIGENECYSLLLFCYIQCIFLLFLAIECRFFFLNSCSIFCDEFEAVCHEVLVSSEKVDKEKLKENFRVSRRFFVSFTVTKRSLISFISNNLQVQEGKLPLIASGSQHEKTLGFCQ